MTSGLRTIIDCVQGRFLPLDYLRGFMDCIRHYGIPQRREDLEDAGKILHGEVADDGL